MRRIFTPTVAGTVIMLIPVTVMPVIFGMLTDVPEGVSPAAAPASAAVTVLVIVGLTLRASGVWRLWVADHRDRGGLRRRFVLRPSTTRGG